MTAVRKYDLVVLGATGFTGSIACEYLCEHYPTLAWLATGRSQTKLKKLQTSCSQIPETAILDVTDAARLDEVVRSTRAVANFAGTPFLNKALPVVEACARHGTHYVDITGETPLQRASYDRHHKAAVASGAIILHQCGYDSVPSDLAAFLAVNHMRQAHGSDVTELHSFAGKSRGGLSGGTLASRGAARWRASVLYVRQEGGRGVLDADYLPIPPQISPRLAFLETRVFAQTLVCS